MNKKGLTAGLSIGLAFLASQHHLIHMLLLTFGLGGAGLSFMMRYPWLRLGMIIMSLVLAGMMMRHIWRRDEPMVMRVLNGASAAITVALVIWSVAQTGLGLN